MCVVTIILSISLGVSMDKSVRGASMMRSQKEERGPIQYFQNHTELKDAINRYIQSGCGESVELCAPGDIEK